VATPQSSLASVGVVLWLKKGRAARGEEQVVLPDFFSPKWHFQ